MDSLQKLLKKKKWDDKVRIIGLSLGENDVEKVKNFVKSKGWDKI